MGWVNGGDRLSGEVVFDFGSAVGDGGDSAEGDGGTGDGWSVRGFVEVDDGGDADQGEVARLALAGLEVEAAAGGGPGGQPGDADAGEDFSWLEAVFAGDVVGWGGEVVCDGDGAAAAGSGGVYDGVEGEEGDGGVGGVDDVAAVAAGEAEVLAVSGDGEAVIPSLFEAVGEGVAVVPAAGTLVEVASQGADVADLGGGETGGGLGEGGEFFPDDGVFRDFGDGGGGSDGEFFTGDGYSLQAGDAGEADEGVRAGDAFLDFAEEVGASGDGEGVFRSVCGGE